MSTKISVDDLAGDLFSLNIRGLRSIAILWARPSAYFDAADDAEWKDSYTPSVRLWLSLIALSSLLQVIWLSPTSPIVMAYADGFREAGLALPETLTFPALGEEAAVLIFTAFPIVQLLTFLFILPLFRVWGRETTFSLRVRYGFATMIPSASLMMIILPGMAGLPSGWASSFGWAIGLVAMTVDTMTVHRSGVHETAGTWRWLRALLIAVIVLGLNVIMHAITQVAGIIFISVKYGLAPA